MAPFGAHYQTIALSLRHCWPEKWDGEGDDFTVQQHTADVASFIAALGARPVHLLGHSRGGHIAFRVAQKFPDSIRALILVEPGGALAPDLETALPPGGEANPNGTKQKRLDLLGFIRQNRDFSMGYERKNQKKSTRVSGCAQNV